VIIKILEFEKKEKKIPPHTRELELEIERIIRQTKRANFLHF